MRGQALQYYEVIEAIEVEHESMTMRALMEDPTKSKKLTSLSVLTAMVKKEIERAMETRNVRMV